MPVNRFVTRPTAIALGALLAFLSIAPPAEAYRRQRPADAPAPIISRITIRATSIFDLDTNAQLRHIPYSTANALHIRTREQVIRRELLFKEGDRLDPFLIAETERNLRALPFIRAARIVKFPQRDGTVALVVYTNDSWTTEPQINLGGVNSIDSVEVGFKEKNLLGLGKTVQFFQEKGKDFTQRTFRYTDPRILGSRWQFDGGVLRNTDGNTEDATVQRPFYSADTRWSARGFVERSNLAIKEFDNNVQTNQYEQIQHTQETGAATKIGGGRDTVNHAGLRYRVVTTGYTRNDQTPIDKTVPDNRVDRTLFLDLDSTHTDFIEATRLEKMNRIEDVNLGLALTVSPGWSPSFITGQTNSTSLDSTLQKKYLFPAGHLLNLSFSYTGRDVTRSAENQLYNAQVKYYHRVSDANTLVLNSRLELGQDLDADNQLKLGGDTGVRAYEKDSFVGSKIWLMNVEDRLFLIDDFANLFAIGGAIFGDSGYAWDKDHPMAISDMKSDVGMGLRLGLTRSSNEVVLRFDLAYRLDAYNKGGDSRWVFSFGTSQAF